MASQPDEDKPAKRGNFETQARDIKDGYDSEFAEMDPASKEALEKGLALQDEGEFEQAIEHYEKALTGGPNDKKVYNNIGLAHHATGVLVKAKEAFDKAIELDDEYGLAWENIGYLYVDANRLDDGEEALNKALELGQTKSSIWVYLGLIQYNKGELNKALKNYYKALEVEPDNVNALNNVAITYHVLSQMHEERESIEMLENATEFFEKALAKDPNEAKVWNNYGVILGFLARYKGSMDAFDKAIFLDPDYGIAHFNKARIHIQKGEDQQAMTQLDIAVKKDNDLYEAAKMDFTLRKITATEAFFKMAPRRRRVRKKV